MPELHRRGFGRATLRRGLKLRLQGQFKQALLGAVLEEPRHCRVLFPLGKC